MIENRQNFKGPEKHRGHRGHQVFSQPDGEGTLVSLLEQVQALDIRLTVDGTYLKLDFVATPPPDLIEQLAKRKAEIIQYLSRSQVDWRSTDWREFFEERASVAQFCGKMSPEDAELSAFDSCVTEWLRKHPTRSDNRCCPECRQSTGLLIPYVTDLSSSNPGHTWLHQACANAWHQARRELSIRCLREMGIRPPQTIQVNDINVSTQITKIVDANDARCF